MKATDDPYASYKLLSHELTARGYTVTTETVDGYHIMLSTAPNGKRWLTKIAHIAYPMTPAYSRQISNEKHLAYEILERVGIPTPYTRVVAPGESLSDDEMKRMFEKYGRLIVKPTDSSLSRGLTLNLTAHDELLAAIDVARQFGRSSKVLVQQQIAGEEVRFLYIDGRIHAALLRETPKVKGDGTKTIEELLVAENTARANIQSMVPYPSLDSSIITAPIDLSCVPDRDEVIELSRSTMIGGGASVRDIIATVHPSYVELATKAARTIGTDFAVVDIMIEDYGVEFCGTNAYFNEFNSAPVLKLFYSCRNEKHVDVVPLIVDAIQKRLERE